MKGVGVWVNCGIIRLLKRFKENSTMKKFAGFLQLLLTTTGCLTNHYEEFYIDKDTEYFSTIPAVNVGNDVELRVATTEEDVINLMEEGYLPIGSSSFLSPYNGMTCAVDTAKKHGAQMALFDIKFKETKNYTSVLFLPTTSTSYTYGTVNASAYGTGGYAHAHGHYSGTTTTTTMNAVPVQRSVDIYSHNALFFKKVDPQSFYGIIPFIPKRLPTEKPDAIVPVTILAVLKGSKAEADGFKRGQRIKAINGKKITNRDSVAVYSCSVSFIKSVEVEK